jgi:hypothetical protein
VLVGAGHILLNLDVVDDRRPDVPVNDGEVSDTLEELINQRLSSRHQSDALRSSLDRGQHGIVKI